MNKFFRFSLGILSITLCFSALAFGQRTSGNIEGTVTDQNGAVVANATVTAQSTGSTTGFNRTATSDSNGRYQFSQIPVGTYRVTATGTGFKTSRQENVTVTLDNTTVVNAALEIGDATAIVDVTSDNNVTIDPSGTKIDTSITKQMMDDLPAGVTFASLLKVAPNVRPEIGGYQIDGASGSENVFIIDGQEVTHFRTGVLNTNFNIPTESVQEVQIKSTGYEAEYGGATGGIINVVTAGGSDAWRGSFGTSFKPAGFQGNPNPVLNSFTDGGNSNVPGNTELWQPKKAGGTDFFPVARVSGPIIKQRLWFSAVYAPQIFEGTRTVDYLSNNIAGNSNTNPNGRYVTETLNYSNKAIQEHAFIRLDAAPTNNLRFFGTYLWNPYINKGLLPSGTAGFSTVPAANLGGSIGELRGPDLLSIQGGRQNANAYNFQGTWNPLNWVVFNGRIGRSFLNERSTAYAVPNVPRIICSQVSGYLTAADTGCIQGYANVSSNSVNNFDVSTRTTYDLDASFVGINAGGRHNIKVGYQQNRLFNAVDSGYKETGLIQLFYGRTLNQLSGAALSSTPLCTADNYPNCAYGSGVLQRFSTKGEASSTNQGLFAQDSWTIANRLTLNLGLRIENEVVPSFGDAEATKAIEFGWGDKISPRIGVAWDPFGDAKTKLFFNYGWFYDRFKYELPRGSFGGDFYRRDWFEILPSRGAAFTNYTREAILGSNPDPIGGTCLIPNSTGFSICQFDYRVPTNLIGGSIYEYGGVDPDIKAARQSEFTFGAERELGNRFVVSGRFTHKQLDRAVEDIGVFNSQGSEAYIIGNPGLGLVCDISTESNYPCTKAERTYNAVEVSLNKSSRNYFYNVNYTWSRLFGNYSGLASTDEGGRNSPGVNRYFDLPPLGFNADGEPDNGLLPTDRTHVVKAYGGYSFDWGTKTHRTGINALTSFQSGTPKTTRYLLYNLTAGILNGRGDLGRTPMFTETDLSINHRYKFGRDARFTIEGFIDIRNLFDERNVLGVSESITSTNFSNGNLTQALSGCTTCGSELSIFQTIFNGGGIRQFVYNYLNNPAVAQSSRISNTYGQSNSWQAGRDVRFGFRFYF